MHESLCSRGIASSRGPPCLDRKKLYASYAAGDNQRMREMCGLLLPQFTFNNFSVYQLDLRMTFCASLSDIVPGYDDAGSVCGRIECAVWHVAQFGATIRPFFNNPSP